MDIIHFFKRQTSDRGIPSRNTMAVKRHCVMKALAVMNLQNDFIDRIPVPEIEKIIPVINRIMHNFEIVTASRDWHPANHNRFVENHPGTKAGSFIEVNGSMQLLWPAHCIQETPGADFIPTIDQKLFTRVFNKGTNPNSESYSCFYDNNSQKQSELEEYLKANQVDELYLAGLSSDYSIKHSAIDAVKLGFSTYIILDACRGLEFRSGDVDNAIRDMTSHGVKVITSDTILMI